MTCQPTDVVLRDPYSERGQRLQIQLLHVGRRGLQDDLELVVAVDAEGILAVSAVHRPPRR
jgi:hypothetical protein